MTRSMTWALSAGGLVLAALYSAPSFAGSSPHPSQSGPDARWSASQVSATIKPGESKQTQVTLMAADGLDAGTVRIVAALAANVQASPTATPRLRRGQTQKFTLTFTSPVDAFPTTMNGVLQLRETEDKRRLGENIAPPLPIVLQIIWPVINGITVPPEPSPTVNNATLAGVDLNTNGVRDDVERILAQNFGGTTDYPYAIAYARAYQEEIVTPTPATRDEALILAANEVCAAQGASDALTLHFRMDDLVKNTPARVEAMRALDDLISGFLGSELPPCAP